MYSAILAATIAMQGPPAIVPAEPTIPLGSIFSDEDYPPDALRRGSEGSVRFRLTIDAEGMPSNCSVEMSSGDPDLDDHTCLLLMSRARFRPARDVTGRAIEGTLESSVDWRASIPLPPYRMIMVAYRAAVIVNVNSDGVSRCSFYFNSTRQPMREDCVGVPPAIMALARRPEARGEGVVVLSFVPEGLELPGRARSFGRLIVESEADLEIDAAGNVQNCRMRIPAGAVTNATPLPPDLCDRAWHGRFDPAIDPDKARGARLHVALYRS